MAEKITDDDRMIRLQVLAAAGISLTAALVIFLLGAPLPRSLAHLALVSTALYSGYYLALRYLPREVFRGSNTLMGLIAAAILSPAVHVTGGIISPFIFMYFSVLVSEALYGLKGTYTLAAILGGYLAVVAGQYSGLLPCADPSALRLYASLPATALIAGITSFYLLLTRQTSQLILAKLRLQVRDEAADKDALLRKFSELNSTAQLGVLAHRIAHDLRGPIASISGYLELEAARPRNAAEKADLTAAGEAVGGLVEALHGITRFGKPGGPGAEKIALQDFLKDLVAIASFSPAARGVRLAVLPVEGAGPAVTASRADLQQACFNVLKNAVEAVSANHDGKQVEILVSRDGSDARISFLDNGPGIPEEALREVFRRTVTTKADGTGVGLLITRDLLLRNRGDIKLRNRPEGGLTAEITLPAA